MMLTAFTLSILMVQTASVPAEAAVSENDTFSWCVTEATAKSTKFRFYSDIFEGRADVNDQGAYQEYVAQAYSAQKKTGGYVTTCETEHGYDAAKASLQKAISAAPKGVSVVTTAWRTRFE